MEKTADLLADYGSHFANQMQQSVFGSLSHDEREDVSGIGEEAAPREPSCHWEDPRLRVQSPNLNGEEVTTTGHGLPRLLGFLAPGRPLAFPFAELKANVGQLDRLGGRFRGESIMETAVPSNLHCLLNRLVSLAFPLPP